MQHVRFRRAGLRPAGSVLRRVHERADTVRRHDGQLGPRLRWPLRRADRPCRPSRCRRRRAGPRHRDLGRGRHTLTVAERDPYGTEELRTRVTAAWADSPARFREDANAEEELVRGAYRDRVLVELAQNAVDAGGSDGTRVRLEIWPDRLVVANTGAPLDAAGVESMSTLRASAKRFDEQVGRFGVGFAAVLTLTDTPQVVSADGAVWWSREHAAQVAATIPPLGPELQRRGQAVPVLRLPFAEGDVHRSGSEEDRKSTRLNSSHVAISYAVFCLKKKTVT